MEKAMNERELLRQAATEYSNYGIIFAETLKGLIGEKPTDGKKIVKYYTRVEKLLDRVAMIASHM